MKPLTTAILVKCGASPAHAGLYTNALNELLPKHGITSHVRLSHFLSQVLHESIGLSHTVENLNYSAEALMRTWEKRFPTMELAKQYARQPQKIANYVYANRNGNGPVDSNDGWTYRGRGPIQITGKAKYIILTKKYGIDYVVNPAYLERPFDGMQAALWFWDDNFLSQLADTDNPVAVTQKINGGQTGIVDRKRLLIQCKSALLPLFD